jgi:hypothetical protein
VLFDMAVLGLFVLPAVAFAVLGLEEFRRWRHR